MVPPAHVSLYYEATALMCLEEIRSGVLEEIDTIPAPSGSSRERGLRIQDLELHLCGSSGFRVGKEGERYEIETVNGTDFVRRARRYARRFGKPFRFDPRQGKGSHGVLYLGDRRTVVKHGELKLGAFQDMLKQPDIPKEDF